MRSVANAAILAQAQEAFLKPPALQVGLELPLNKLRKQPASLGAQFAKCGKVLLDELIQQRGFGSVPAIAGRIDKWRRSRSPARAVTDMVGVPATGGDATNYGAPGTKGIDEPAAFDRK